MARRMEELNMSGENLTKGDEVHKRKDGKKEKYRKRKCLNGISKYGNKSGGKLEVVFSCILRPGSGWGGIRICVLYTHKVCINRGRLLVVRTLTGWVVFAENYYIW